jgi:hypothetical protein
MIGLWNKPIPYEFEPTALPSANIVRGPLIATPKRTNIPQYHTFFVLSIYAKFVENVPKCYKISLGRISDASEITVVVLAFAFKRNFEISHMKRRFFIAST